LHLGYRAAQLLGDGVLGAKGARLRGHEFHYASLVAPGDDEAFAEISDAEGRSLGRSGGRRGRVTGTFFHAIAADDS
jgi:cobyrinic acid a,c-diamide synthase